MSSVEQGSPAQQRGLRQGDLIIAVNRTRVTNLRELQEVAQASQGLLMLNIRRGTQALILPIR